MKSKMLFFTLVFYNLEESRSYYASRGGSNITTDETGQKEFSIASRLIPRHWVIKEEKREVFETLRFLLHNGGFIFNCILGGAVNDVGDNDTAVHPAMRKVIVKRSH